MKRTKIKVLYVVSTLRRSGPTNQLLGIISNLDKNTYSVKIITLSAEPQNTRKPEFLNLGIDISTLELSRIKFEIMGLKLLKEKINEIDPDVIHTQGVRADVAVSKIGFRDRHCLTIRNYVYEDYISKFGKVVGGIAAQKSINAFERCDYIVCCSKTLQSMYSKLITKEITAIQNGVDTSRFVSPKSPLDKNQTRRKLNLDKDAILYLCVGSLIPRKNPKMIIQAFANVKNTNNSYLIILGNGPLKEACVKEANENVIFRGEVSNVDEYYAACDYYISASDSEGLPNTVLEAGSSGLNMILSDIPQHLEIFEGLTKDVKWFSTKTTDELTRRLEESNTILRNEGISQYIDVNFSMKSMSSKYSDMYKLIYNNKSQ